MLLSVIGVLADLGYLGWDEAVVTGRRKPRGKELTAQRAGTGSRPSSGRPSGTPDWILQVKSMDEAVEWANRVPFEALFRIYPASTAPWARSRSVICSSRSILTHRPSATQLASGRYLTGL